MSSSSAVASTGSTASAASDLKKAVAAKEREVDYKITHYASFADNIEQVCERETTDNVCIFFLMVSEFSLLALLLIFLSCVFFFCDSYRQMTLMNSTVPTICVQYAEKRESIFRISIYFQKKKNI
jgi:glycogen synthase